jgi:hypothetical protein
MNLAIPFPLPQGPFPRNFTIPGQLY